MTFNIDPDGTGGGRRKPKLRDAEGERLQKLENATFVTRAPGYALTTRIGHWPVF